MLPVANRGAGQFIATPDVCLTPPAAVPIPYVDVGLNAMASVFSPNVFLSMLPALTVGSVIPTTFGDEPGCLSPIMGPAVVVTSFNNVFFNGLMAATLCSITTGNGGNAPGIIAVPSAVTVFAAHRAEGVPQPASPGRACLREALELAGALESAARDGDNVSGRMIAPATGLLAVRLFSLDVPARAHAVIRDLLSRGMESLIIDVRGNPGGDLRAALELASDFLDEGTLLATVEDEDGDTTEHRARPGEPHRFPLCVRVDGQTASAAEAFAGCLKAHGRATVVGEPTFGKGWGKRLVPMPGEPELGAAHGRVMLPDGSMIGRGGIAPDVRG